MSLSISEQSDDGSVVAGSFPFARFGVDKHILADLKGRFRQEKVVDSQPLVLLESSFAVAPPGIDAFFFVMLAEAIFKAEVHQMSHCFAFGGGAMDLFSPHIRVMDVPVIEGDVEVSRHDDFFIRSELVIEQLSHALEPGEFVVVLFVVDLPSIGHVEVEHDGVLHDAAEDAFRFAVTIPGKRLDHAFHRVLAEGGYSVVGLLAGELDVVAGVFQGFGWKQIVDDFGFLEAQDVGVVIGEPVEQE